MKKNSLYIISLSLICIFAFASDAYAPWIWTPETKKFTNPKNAVKDTPKEQFDWAMSFYDAKDYQRASFEFDKLAKQYEFSDYASKSQYYVGLCNENMQKYYTAFESYQKAIDNFPHLSNIDEVLARQYAIGLIYLEKPSPKVMGNDIMAPLDRAVEIFKKVVENAPYGKYAHDAQFKLGEALKKSERYDEAVQAYHKLVEDYPNSEHATKAMYEESHCAYKASLRPAYDASATDSAIKTFEKFVNKNKDSELAQKADKTMKRLKDNVAEKSFETAQFYESQGKPAAAIIYYQDVIDTYPDSSFVDKAKAKVEALKNPKPKKVAAPLEFKKKPRPVSQEAQKKAPWRPLSFLGAKKQDPAPSPVETPKPVEVPKAEPVKIIAETPAPVPQSQPSVVEPAPEAVSQPPVEAPKAEEAPQALVETPKAEPVAQVVETPKTEEVVVPVREAPKKKAWKPFSFDSKKKDVAVQTKETPKKDWKPFNFDKKKEAAAKTEEAVAQSKETPKKKAWKPFNFDTEKESVKEVQKKEWIPLYFGTNDEPMGVKRPEAQKL
ncbi:MAG: outer membrane protein assembly factor BamD [Candidatus Omnitrophota bacterium]|nr:outer membrane protein assembly factor BamD [Candidatus Omnitrophota bacterium]